MFTLRTVKVLYFIFRGIRFLKYVVDIGRTFQGVPIGMTQEKQEWYREIRWLGNKGK